MESKLTPLTERMSSVCKSLYGDCPAHDYLFTPMTPRGMDDSADAVAMYKFEGFDVALIFNSRMGNLYNVLECRIALNAGEKYVDFSLYDLMYLLNENDFKCYIFPYIDSAERMETCLRLLFDAVMNYREQLGGIGTDEALCERAKNHKKKEMLRFFKHDIFHEVREQADPILAWRLRGYREWYLSRFCSKWYGDYMSGNYERAAKRLEAYDSKCDYELRMYRFLKALGTGAVYTAAPAEANTFAQGNRMKSARSRSVRLTAMVIGIASSFAGYTLIGYLAHFAIYWNALYASSLYDIWIPLTALMCAIPTGFALGRLIWHRLLSVEERDAVKEAGLSPSPIELKAHKSAVHTALIIGLLIATLAAKSSLAIYDTGIVDNTSPLESRSLPYSDVQMVIYERESDSYHIYFKGKGSLSCSPEMAKEYILDNLKTPVKEVDKIEGKES